MKTSSASGLSLYALISLGFLGIVAAIALLAPLIYPLYGHLPDNTSLFNRFAEASAEHWLGTDQLGRDVFVRLIEGARISLTVGIITALCSATLGTTIGLIAGYCRGWVDALLMRVADLFLALPLLPLLIVVSAIDFSLGGSQGSGLAEIILIISIFSWPATSRLIRAGTISARENDYVLAAKALGAPAWRVTLTHILPNVIGPMIVATTLAVGNIILLESSLSFLGLGIQPPTSSWGNMLTGAQDTVWDAPLLSLWPGLAILMTVMACNIIGDAFKKRI